MDQLIPHFRQTPSLEHGQSALLLLGTQNIASSMMAAFVKPASLTRQSFSTQKTRSSPFLPSNYARSGSNNMALPADSSLQTFEPILPDTATLAGFGGILVLCVALCWVWANQVVPVSRTNLAISKRSGPLKDYLDELQETPETTNSTTTATESSRAFERWLFTDWLEKRPATGGRQKEPALPVLKSAKWNSGDNPVLVAGALIGMGVLLTSIAEKILS